MEYAYRASTGPDERPPTMLDWFRGDEPIDDPQIALRIARAKAGPNVLVHIAEIAVVDLEKIRPDAETILGDMKERLVGLAGEYAERKLDELDRDQINQIDDAIRTALENVFTELGIKLDAFTIKNVRTVKPGQAWA
jgi:hypothetical protein